MLAWKTTGITLEQLSGAMLPGGDFLSPICTPRSWLQKLHTAKKGYLSTWARDPKLGMAQQAYIWRSIFLDSLYLRSRRLRIRILLIHVTFSGIRALAVPFLLPRKGKQDENEAKFLKAEQHAFAEALNLSLYFKKRTTDV